MNNLDKQYLDLLQDILDNGVAKQDRTGTGTISVFGRQIRHKMSEGFPLLTTKKMPFRLIVTELIWFLRGDTNIKFLVDNDCHIWDGDAYKNYVTNVKRSIDRATADGILQDDSSEEYSYLSKESFIQRIKTDAEFAKKWGDLGPVYGKQWRKWGRKGKYMVNEDLKFSNGTFIEIDQITNLIRDLKTNPDSRRLMVSAWNVGELDSMTLPPCHYGFQIYTRELDETERVILMDKKLGVTENLPPYYTEDEMIKHNIPKRAISLMWNQRSVDTFLGLPFNIASYGLLLEIIAKAVNMVPDELIGNLGDTHLYLNHVEQAKEQIGRELSLEERRKLANHGSQFVSPMMVESWDRNNIPTRTREPYPLPTLNQFPTYEGTRPSIESYDISDFTLKDYQAHPSIKAPLSN